VKSKSLSLALRVLVILVLAVGTAALAQAPRHLHFTGVINDYTPAVGSTGPWEVRGPWTMTLDERSGKADFSAAVTMELSDSSLTSTNIAASARMQHTHHLTVEGGTVAPITGGFEVTGPVTITKDGGPAPAAIQGSSLVIDVTGGTLVEFSNITLTFEDGAIGHFGSDPIHGVVRKVKDFLWDDSHR
jgi:hypothetical protein